MNGCPNCSAVVNNDQSSIICDGCKRTVHTACLQLTEDDVRLTRHKSKNIKCFCNTCNTNADHFDDIKRLLSNLQNDFQAKIADLQRKLDAKQSEILSPAHSEEIITEATERLLRANNIIVFNVPETGNATAESDQLIAEAILKKATGDQNIAKPTQVIRLGKAGDKRDKIRPLKVVTASPMLALTVLRNQAKLRGTNYAYALASDKTPRQQEFYQSLKTEMNARMEKGEKDLILKYVKGIPTITRKDK